MKLFISFGGSFNLRLVSPSSCLVLMKHSSTSSASLYSEAMADALIFDIRDEISEAYRILDLNLKEAYRSALEYEARTAQSAGIV